MSRNKKSAQQKRIERVVGKPVKKPSPSQIVKAVSKGFVPPANQFGKKR